MPIYEYRCVNCGEVFSVLKFGSNHDETKCPHCGSKDVKKKVSTFCSFGSVSGGSDYGSFSGG